MIKFKQMDDLIDQFINSLHLRETTKDTYSKALREFAKWLGKVSPLGLKSNDIEKYKDYLISKDLSSTSVSAYLTAVRRLYYHLEATGQMSHNPAKQVKGSARPKKHLTGSISEDDVDKLFSVIDMSTSVGLRDAAILNLMVRCAVSEIEVVRTNLEDLTNTKSDLRLYVQGKNKDKKDEYVTIPTPVEQILNRYLANKGQSTGNTSLFWGSKRTSEAT